MKRDTEILQQLETSDDEINSRKLNFMRAIALGMLIVSALLFVLARWHHGQHAFWAYLEAFSEAAMVGAIADWFAVTALFRHPLGIPLWHTAIIPNSKDDIGRSLGNFVENHFVTEESITLRLRAADPARLIGAYFLHPANAEKLSDWAATGLEALMKMADHEAIRQAVREFASKELGRIELSVLAGGCVDALVADEQPQKLLDAILEQIATYLADEDNHPDAEKFIFNLFGTDSAVMRKMLGMAVPRIITSIRDGAISVRMNRAHPLRWRVSG